MTAEGHFEKGLALLKAGNRLAALGHFEKAHKTIQSPEVMSYLGYCMAAERGVVSEAIGLCSEALSQEPENPLHYLNLGRVYRHAGLKNEAIDTFRKGLSYGDNEEIRAILDSLGLRKKPVFPSLPRSHSLNKYAGLLLHRLRLR